MTMHRCVRASTMLLSACVHAVLFGGVYAFSRTGDTAPEDEPVYQVALAEFAAPAAPAAESVAPAQEAAPDTGPEPVPVPEPEAPPESEPASVPEKAVSEVVGPKKKKEPAPLRKKEAPRPAPPVPVPPSAHVGQGPAAPVPGRVGAFLAYETDQVDQRPSIVRRSSVEYPSRARRRAIEGRVVVQLVVDTEGRARECRIRSAEPGGWFEDAALAAAEKMRFMPGRIKGKAVNTVVLVPFSFSLR